MGWVFPIIRNEKTSTLPTCQGVWEKGKLFERQAGVAESSGQIQVTVKPKILRVDWEAIARMKFVDRWLTIPETHRKWQRCSKRGADRTQFSKIALPFACDVRALLRGEQECIGNILPPTWLYLRGKEKYTYLRLYFFYITEINYCILENNLLLCYWLKYYLAGVWWAFWRNMAAVTSSRWMLHSWDWDSPFHVKRFEYPEKR